MRSNVRIALVFFMVTLAIMIVLSGAVYYFVTEYTYTDFYKGLQTRAVLTARIALDKAVGLLGGIGIESPGSVLGPLVRSSVETALQNAVDPRLGVGLVE